MRLAMAIDYTRDPRTEVATIVACEGVGLDAVFVPEAWGYDAPSIMGYLAACTTRSAIVSGVLPVGTRSASVIAQTAATIDHLSNGRCELGLGTSGPQVIEGFHGIPYTHVKDRLIDTIGICRQLWAGASSQFHGNVIDIPTIDPTSTGRGRALRLGVTSPVGPIPIHLAVMRPSMVEVCAEYADGWYPLFFVPDRAESVWGKGLARGASRRSPALSPLQIHVQFPCAIGRPDDIASTRDAARADIARYVGGMGARGMNFYTDVIGDLGWSREALHIQDLYLSGARGAAAHAIPDDLLDALTLIGTEAQIAERLAMLVQAGVTTLIARPFGGDPVALIRTLRRLLDNA